MTRIVDYRKMREGMKRSEDREGETYEAIDVNKISNRFRNEHELLLLAELIKKPELHPDTKIRFEEISSWLRGNGLRTLSPRQREFVSSVETRFSMLARGITPGASFTAEEKAAWKDKKDRRRELLRIAHAERKFVAPAELTDPSLLPKRPPGMP